jgi:hypothetical protein
MDHYFREKESSEASGIIRILYSCTHAADARRVRVRAARPGERRAAEVEHKTLFVCLGSRRIHV